MSEKKKDFLYVEPEDYFPRESRERFIKEAEKKNSRPKIEREPPADFITTTELVFILDRSGSMSGLESDTIGGFNGMIKEQKAKEGKCFVTTVLFDHERLTLHDRLPLEKIKKMTENDYQVRGCTALLDAIGTSIIHIDNIHRYARDEDVPDNTVFVIITDGMENASKEFSYEKIKKMIEQKKKGFGWEFLFIGANMDAVETATHMGIDEDRAVNYHADKAGTKVVYKNISNAVGCVRDCVPLGKNWSEEIDRDYKKRK